MNVNKLGGAVALVLLLLSAQLHAESPDAVVAVDPKSGLLSVRSDKTKDKTVIAQEVEAAARAAASKPDYVAAALQGITEITVDYPLFSDPSASNECGLSRETLLTIVQRNLQDPNLNIILLDNKRPRKGGRANLFYEISTTREQQICLSWISLRLVDQVQIVPAMLKLPRTLEVVFWQKSVLARSISDRHQASVGDALAAIERQFLRDLKLAEPVGYATGFVRTDSSQEEERKKKNDQMLNSINNDVSHRLSNPTVGADVPINGLGVQPRVPIEDRQ